MILHATKQAGMDVDYVVGSSIEGFELSAKVTEENKYIVIEGDEYLSSAIHRTPKIHWYKP